MPDAPTVPASSESAVPSAFAVAYLTLTHVARLHNVRSRRGRR